MDDIFSGAVRQHGCLISFGGVPLGPAAETPGIKLIPFLQESFLYEDAGSRAVCRKLHRYQAEIHLSLKGTDQIFELLSEFVCGTRIDGENRSRTLSFVPVIEAGEQGKTLTFPAAYLLPELEYLPSAGKNHLAKVCFQAFPDAEGRLFLIS